MKNLIKKIQDLINRSNLAGIIIGIISFLSIFLFSLSETYDLFEYRLYDLRFKMKPSIYEWDFLSFLNIDESSINNVGEYPWPRHFYASALDILKEVGIRQLAFDFEFQDQSPKQINSDMLEKLNNKIERKQRISKDELANVVQDNDKIFASSMKLAQTVILPFHFQKETLGKRDVNEQYRVEEEKARETFINKASVKVPDDKIDYYKDFIDSERVGIALPIPELVKAAYAFGFVDRDPDIDGIERKIRLVRLFEGRLYFQLGLVMLMDIYGIEKKDVLIQPGKRIVLKDAINPITHQRDDINIPIDEKGMIYINWAGSGPLEESFHHISFYALLEYPHVKNEIHSFFDEQDRNTEKMERKRLYRDLEVEYNRYYTSNNIDQKRGHWKKIIEIKEKIREIEKAFKKPILEAIKNIREELKREKADELEEMLIDYKNYLKAMEIVTEIEGLRDKIAIIGLTATGTQDLGAIPIYHEYMMVGTHYNIINTILNKSFIIKVSKYTDYIIMFTLALMMGIVIQRMGARFSLFVIIISLFAINLINLGLFSLFNIFIDQLGVNLSIFLPSTTIAAMKFMREESRRRFIKHAFAHYLSPKVIDQLINEPDLLKLGGESRTLTVFFSDVANFSTISEALSPTELVILLNEYLSEMTDIILEYEGTVDKYEGDAIMGFYGAPQHLKEHAVNACFAAIDMQKRLEDMRSVWRKQGKHELYVRMGLNSGDAVVGNMGSKTRMDYTVMGDSVNLASRLEGANKFYNTYTMISENTYEEAKEQIETRKLDTIRVVGKDVPINVYELLGRKGELSDQMIEMLDKYNRGLEHFRNREWKRARSLFRSALKILKDDGPSRTYYERCYEFYVKPPPKTWDGVYTLKSK